MCFIYFQKVTQAELLGRESWWRENKQEGDYSNRKRNCLWHIDREVKESRRGRERWAELLNKRVEVYRNVSLARLCWQWKGHLVKNSSGTSYLWTVLWRSWFLCCRYRKFGVFWPQHWYSSTCHSYSMQLLCNPLYTLLDVKGFQG